MLASEGLVEATTRSQRPRRIFVIRQDQVSRAYRPIGVIERTTDTDHWTFRYLSAATQEPSFVALTAFPDPSGQYESVGLPEFVGNRLMDSNRASYRSFVESLGLDPEAPDPLEELARTGGGRATDDLHVFAEPVVTPSGRFTLHFFVHGLRYFPEAMATLSDLSHGEALYLEAEPDNPADANAQLVVRASGATIGYVPGWLAPVVRDALAGDPEASFVVERVNSEMSSPNLRVLCRVEAVVGADFDPFGGPEFSS